MTRDDHEFEWNINLRQGFLTKYEDDDLEYIVKVPSGFKAEGPLCAPTNVLQKGIVRGFDIR